MSYCKSCGAYIPDGSTTCLACGYDETAERRKETKSEKGYAGTGSAAQQKKTQDTKDKYKRVDGDFLKKQLEEQRKRQQENSRKWAETEYRQRQKKTEEQKQNFTNTSSRTGSDVYHSVRRLINSDTASKLMAGLSYFSVLFIFPYLFRKDDKFAVYHAKQGMNLFVAGLAADLVGGFLGMGWLVALARIYMIFEGIGNVVNGRKKPLPYIGNLLK